MDEANSRIPCRARQSAYLYLWRPKLYTSKQSETVNKLSVTYLVVVLPADGVRRLGAQPDDAGQIDGAAHADEDLATA